MLVVEHSSRLIKSACPIALVIDLNSSHMDFLTVQQHQVKRSQIEGLKLIENLFIYDYDDCLSGFSSKDSLRQHCLKAHTAIKKAIVRHSISTPHHTLKWTPSLLLPALYPQELLLILVLSSMIERQRSSMTSIQNTIPLTCNLSPIFVELGFYTFIESLD